MHKAAAAVAALTATAQGKLAIYTVGDSFGAEGPTYHVIEDALEAHGIEHQVASAAKGGLASCDWAEQDGGMKMVNEARRLFPNRTLGPDHVWFSFGADDQVHDKPFQACLKSSRSQDQAVSCIDTEVTRVANCSATMLENYWDVFPSSRVLFTGYDIPCFNFFCMTTFERLFYRAFCGDDVACFLHLGQMYQTRYAGNLTVRLRGKPFEYRPFWGAVQKAAGIPGAEVGSPNLTVGAKCAWEYICLHPKYGSPAGDAWRDAFWDLYFSKRHGDSSHVVV